MTDLWRRLFRRRGWCYCGHPKRTGTHSADACGPLDWGF